MPMKLIHLVPPADGFIVEGSSGTQRIPCIVEDGGDWFAMILDSSQGTMHIEQFIDRNAVFLTSAHNLKKIEDDEQWNAINKFMHDSGTGIFADGQRHAVTGSIVRQSYG